MLPSFLRAAKISLISRRQFSKTIAGAAAACAGAGAQTPIGWSGAKIVDCHHHLRRAAVANIAHLDGCGVSNGMALANENSAEAIAELRSKYPGRVLGWFARADITKPDAADLLTKAIRNGACGFGELKFHVEAAGPELRRMYALAAELGVAILIHFQEVPHTPTEGVFATGFKNFEAMLKAYPKTRFIGHADAFWANISADYANDVDYPKGRIRRGGVSQQNNPGAARLAGRCVARETLSVLKRSTTPAIFRKLTWENAHRTYALKA